MNFEGGKRKKENFITLGQEVITLTSFLMLSFLIENPFLMILSN